MDGGLEDKTRVRALNDGAVWGTDTVHGVLERWAEREPDRPYLTVGDDVWSMGQINTASNRLAHALWNHGITNGSRVALMMAGSVDYVIVWFALSKLGAIEVPINTAYKGNLLDYILEKSETAAIIVDAAFLETISEAAEKLATRPRIMVNGEGESDTLHSMMKDAPETNPDVPVKGNDPACIIFTSGTTGPSKGVIITQAHEVSFGRFFNEITSMSGSDVGYNYLPFFHIAAKFLSLGTMLEGAQMALVPAFSLSSFWKDVQRYKATICIAVGGLCHMLRSQPATAEDARNTLRLIYAVPIPSEFKEEFETRFGLSLIEGYGSTESNLIVYSRPEPTPPGSCGRANSHFHVAILGENGEILPPGEIGEICARPLVPQTIMQGYLGMPEKTLEVFEGLWFHTGDGGYQDENGFFYFKDRLKDSIRRRGENISSFEVERQINAHPDVAESAVVAAPSELAEDEVLAVVVPRQGATLAPEALLLFCAETMPYFMVPRFIRVRDTLPRTPTQKVRKVELREEGITEDTWDSHTAGFKVTRHGLQTPS